MGHFDFLKDYNPTQRYDYLKDYFIHHRVDNYTLNELVMVAPELIDVCYDLSKSNFPNVINLLDYNNKNNPKVVDKLINLFENKDLTMDSKLVYSLSNLDKENLNKLIEISFSKDYQNTLIALSKRYDCLDRDNLISILNKHCPKAFVIDEDTKNLAKIESNLLLTSLENDFDTTLNYYCKSIEEYQNNSDAKNVKELYLSKIRNTDFILTRNNINLTLIDPEFIDISLKNNPEYTFSLLLDYKNDSIAKYLLSENFFKIIDNNKDFYLTNETYKQYYDLFFYKNSWAVDLLVETVTNSNFMKTISLSNVPIKCSKQKIIDELLNKDNILPKFYRGKKFINDFLDSDISMVEDLYNTNKQRCKEIIYHTIPVEYTKDLEMAVKEILTKDKYVLGYENNNPYLSKIMFFESLKNDYEKTINFNFRGFYRTDEFLDYQFDTYGDEFKDVLIKDIAFKDARLNSNHFAFFNKDPSILIKALNLNYDNVMDNFNNTWNLLDKIEIKDENLSAELIDTLMAHNFALNDSNRNLALYSPCFLIASLKDDYKATKAMIEKEDLMSTYKLNDYESEQFMELFIDNQDNDLYYKVSVRNINLFINLLIEDKEKALEELKNIKTGSINISKEDALTIKGILNYYDFSFKDCLPLANLLAFPLLHFTSSNEAIDIRTFLMEHDFPLSLLDFKSYDEVKLYLDNDKERELYKKYFENNGFYEYKKEDEDELLAYLNTGSKTIEEEVKRLNDLNLKRTDLNLMNMLSIIFYAKKLQFQKGVEGFNVDLFEYSNDYRLLGSFTDILGNINLMNGHNNSVFNMVKILHHEINHSVQHINQMARNIDADRDIIVYGKDKLLRTILMSMYNYNYYEANYKNITLEYDTEFKSQMETIALLKKKPEDNQELYIQDSLELFNYGKDNNKYEYNNLRKFDGNEYYLNDLFYTMINRAIKQDEINFFKINDEAPILLSEYKMTEDGLKLRSNKEMIDVYLKADKKDKKEILALISNRLDYRYNKDVESNIEDFMDCNDKAIEAVIIEQLEAYANYKKGEIKNLGLDKYLKYIDVQFDKMMINNKKR